MTNLVIGGDGFIGKNLISYLQKTDKDVEFTTRRDQSRIKSSFLDHETDLASNFGCKKYEKVFIVSGFYQALDLTEEWQRSFESNFLLQRNCVEFFLNKVPAICLVGSYFEMAPELNQPWSYYAWIKRCLRNTVQNLARQSSTTVITYVYLYDNYGYSRERKKFLDVLIEMGIDAYSQSTIKSTEGRQLINLTDIRDVCKGLDLAQEISSQSTESFREYQIKSPETYSLRELHSMAEKKLKRKIPIEFGAIPYRKREVFELWDCAPSVPGLTFDHNLQDFLIDNFTYLTI